MKETIIGLKELRENMETYAQQVQKGKTFLVVKRSKPLFKITPIDEEDGFQWETLVDFTKIKKKGARIEDVLKHL